MTAVTPLEVLGTGARAQLQRCHSGGRLPGSCSDGTLAAVTSPATGFRKQGFPIGGGTTRRRRDGGADTLHWAGKEGGGTHAAVQTEAEPCTVEAGVGTGSWGGTCHVATSAAVDSREIGTCTSTAALSHLGTQTDDVRFRSFEEVVDYCRWFRDIMPHDVPVKRPPCDTVFNGWNLRRTLGSGRR